MKTLLDSFLTATIAAPLLLTLASTLRPAAAEPVVPTPAASPTPAAPAPYHFQVGGLDCWILYDTRNGYDPTSLFVNAPPAELEQALQRHGETGRKIFTPYAALLVKTPGNTVLIDTGAYAFVGAKRSHLMASLAAIGVTPGQIDTVLLTHGHPDHIGGTLDADGQPAFPHARFVMFRQEWDCWIPETPATASDPQQKFFADFARRQLLPLRDQMELIEHDTEVRPGIVALLAAGHTPGHMVVKIGPAGHELIYVADLVLSPIGVEHPEWHSKFECDIAQAQAAARRFLGLAADGRMLVYAMHFPWPGLGHVAIAGDQWIWQPVAAATD
ncbi:MAG TPA: MBL fold metallo-hydrolase [Opitutaceae bacterium]|nr:MBL fold metallo-hydrolase [Opitutaceae bacterium]